MERFLSTYPDVVLELVTDERLVDIVAERFDAGIRLGEQVVRDMVAVQVGGRQRLVVVRAHPGALAPATADLGSRRTCWHTGASCTSGPGAKRIGGSSRKGAASVRLQFKTGALFENDTGIALRAVLTGRVIGFAFEAQVAPHLAKRTLKTVLDDWCPSFPGFHLCFPFRREVTPALRAFIETMKGDS